MRSEAQKRANKKWVENNRDKINEYVREYYKRPGVKERQKEYMKKYFQKPDVKKKNAAYKKQWEIDNKDKRRKTRLQWYQDNKEEVIEKQRIKREEFLKNRQTVYCLVCNEVVELPRTKYCSDICMNRDNQLLIPRKPKITRQCIVCNNTFETHKSLVCSLRCRTIHYRKPIQKTIKQCAICNETFEAYKAVICSPKCRYKLDKRNIKDIKARRQSCQMYM